MGVHPTAAAARAVVAMSHGGGVTLDLAPRLLQRLEVPRQLRFLLLPRRLVFLAQVGAGLDATQRQVWWTQGRARRCPASTSKAPARATSRRRRHGRARARGEHAGAWVCSSMRANVRVCVLPARASVRPCVRAFTCSLCVCPAMRPCARALSSFWCGARGGTFFVKALTLARLFVSRSSSFLHMIRGGRGGTRRQVVGGCDTARRHVGKSTFGGGGKPGGRGRCVKASVA